ncbi:MAG: glycosyltransferase family A protein [Eubacteriales bacterium]
MKLQTLVSAVNQDVNQLAQVMNLQSDAIIINQCDENEYTQYDYHGNTITCYSFAEKGVGLSRNNGLLRADSDIILFADEDIVYVDGYAQLILQAFKENQDADMLLFNMDVAEDRRTYDTKEKTRIRIYNSGRYPTYSFAIRLERLRKSGTTFSLLFGGGAKYSNGEDSLFLRECLSHRLKIYALPITIGKEVPRPSTWFSGYTEKFFFDRGVLYVYLYGKLKYVMALRFLLKHRKLMCETIPVKKAFALMKVGMKEASK